MKWVACGCRKTEGGITWVCNRENGHPGHHCQFARNASGQERNVWWHENKELTEQNRKETP